MTIEVGKTVYGQDGRRGEYVAPLNDRHLVRPIARFIDEYGDDYEDVTDALELWPRVFLKAPVSVISDEIAALKAEAKELEAGLADLRERTREAQRDHLATLARLKRYEPLKHLEEVLNGTITHVVELGGSSRPWIRTFAEALPYHDDYDRKDKLRFLTIAPTEDGVITWHLTRYGGGTGDRNRVYLCTSRDDAVEIARQILLADFEDSQEWRWPDIVECAAKNGIQLPAEYVEKAAAFRRKRAQEAVDKAAQALAEAESKLGQIGGAPQ